MEDSLARINVGMPYNSIYSDLEKAGAKARQILLQKYIFVCYIRHKYI